MLQKTYGMWSLQRFYFGAKRVEILAHEGPPTSWWKMYTWKKLNGFQNCVTPKQTCLLAAFGHEIFELFLELTCMMYIVLFYIDANRNNTDILAVEEAAVTQGVGSFSEQLWELLSCCPPGPTLVAPSPCF